MQNFTLQVHATEEAILLLSSYSKALRVKGVHDFSWELITDLPWDHTVLPATRLYHIARQAGTRFPIPRKDGRLSYVIMPRRVIK